MSENDKTPADKLRELLATRPQQPNLEELVRWWRSSTELVPAVLTELAGLQLEVDAHNTASTPAFDEIAKLCGCPQWDYPGQLIRDVQNVVQECDELRAAVDVLNQEVRELEQQREASRTAARDLMAHVDDLAAFADDNDPRVMATAAPLGAAQANLWIALGMNLDEERARIYADIESRCAVCGWSLAGDISQSCTRGNCSMRPRPEKLYAPERAEREANDRSQRELMEAGHA